MADEPNNTSDRLEKLLRRWGAEEAARSAEAPPAPAAPAHRVGHIWGRVLRWGSLAAAAMLLVAAGFCLNTLSQPAPRAGRIVEVPLPGTLPASRPGQEELERLRQDLADLKAQLAESRRQADALADLPRKIAELEAHLQTEQNRHAADVREFLAAANARQQEIRDLTDRNSQLAGKLSSAQERLAALEPAAAELPQVKADVKALQTRLAAAVNEMENLRKQREEAEAATADARRQAEMLQARHAEVVAAFQRTYLASVAPDERGLAARKTAARVRRMVQRCAELTADARSEAAQKLLARLEAVLTRLDLLNPARIGAEESFTKLLRQSDLARDIDEVLSAGTEPEEVRNWLFEAQLILMGADHAG